MKRIIAFAVCLVLALSALSALAADSKAVPEGLVYEIVGGEAHITAYAGNASTLVLPSVIDGSPLTVIGEGAFRGCTSIVSLTIPKSVQKIGRYALENCNSLKNLTIPFIG